MTEGELKIGTPEDYYQLDYCREAETRTLLAYLNEHPFVFLYSSAGNGKTSFGVEFRQRVPNSVLILGGQLGIDRETGVGLYDDSFLEAGIIVVDEFDAPISEARNNIDSLLSMGKKFVFMVHYPKNRYVKWREQRQEYLEQIVGLVNDYPNTPWLHLARYND